MKIYTIPGARPGSTCRTWHGFSFSLKKWPFFPPPLFFSSPNPFLQWARRWKPPVCWVRTVEKSKFRHGEQFSDLATYLAFLILDPSGHNLPDSHPLVPGASFGQNNADNHCRTPFLGGLKCLDRQEGCAWVVSGPKNKKCGGKVGQFLLLKLLAWLWASGWL